MVYIYLDHEVMGSFLYVIYLWYLLPSQAETAHSATMSINRTSFSLLGFVHSSFVHCAVVPILKLHNCVKDY